MKSLRWGVTVCAVAVLVGALNTACSRHFVIVPQPENGYAPTDTLYGHLNGDEIRVTFWFDTIMRVDTVVRADTLWVEGARTILRVDTVRVRDTVVRVDTVRVSTTETVVDTVLRVDTVRVAVHDTVRVAGQRMLFVPPGHYPLAGQCRVWIHDLPPGRQARAAACEALGEVPAGAFILFGGEAWDFDYDWLAVAEDDPDAVPPEIVAVKRRG
ncbi:MAG TPA: hypothetical protein VMM83_07495 [Longimicrobiales bacterium]|nr:hypothetical protein [Longimicrobiales bacterium]